MSVINTMLRDLDARGAGAASAASAAAPPGLPPARHPARRLGVIVALGVAAIGLAAFGDVTPLLGVAGARGGATAGPALPGQAGATEASVADGASGAGTAAGAPVPAAESPRTPAGHQPPGAAAATTPTAPAGPAAIAASTPAPTPAPTPETRTPPAVAPARPANTGPELAAQPPTSPTPPGARVVPAPARRAAAVAPAEAAPPAADVMPPLRARADLASLPPTPPRIDKRPRAPDAAQRQALLYRQAVDAAQAGQRLASIALAHEVLAQNPRHEPARQLAAHLEFEAGSPERAVTLLRDGLAQPGAGPALALALARVLAAEGLPDEALAVLDAHQVTGPEAAGLRGGVLARRGDYAAALPAYEAAARAQPMNGMWWLGLGVALDALGEPARARQAFAKAQAVGLPRDDLASYAEQRLRALE